MNLQKFYLFFKIFPIFFVFIVGIPIYVSGQKINENISTVVIDSAPKKLYSELYLDESGNQFLVEIYEEPQEGENLIHFRTFKNAEIIGRKSQALADSHNFTFFIDESEQRIMKKDTEQMLYNVLKKLMEESDQKLKSKLEDLFDQEKMAKSLSEKIKTPERQIKNMAQKISEQIKDDENISDMAQRISKEIKTPEEQISAMASRISKEIKTPDEQIASMAEQISLQIKTPEEQISTMANQISEKITFDGGTISDMATRISKEIKTPEEQISTMAQKISEKIKDEETISEMATRISKEIKTPEEQISAIATRISKEIKTPDEQISTMAEKISQQIKTPEARVNEDNLALNLAIKLTQDENLVATKIPPYQELLTQVSASNEQQDYEKTIKILDEDIADRTPDEQRKALKISGLMSVLVASKKLKRALSTIEDYDLPDDPGLREISSALSEWLAKNLVLE